jgi:hypothetical protein
MVNKLVEVLPMVMDILTISAFAVLLVYKMVVYISLMFGGGIHIFKKIHSWPSLRDYSQPLISA